MPHHFPKACVEAALNVDWVATFNRIFIALVCAAAVGVVYIVVSVLSALLSGRIAAVLESIRAAH